MKRLALTVASFLGLASLVAVIFGGSIWLHLPKCGLLGLCISIIALVVMNIFYSRRDVMTCTRTMKDCGEFDIMESLIISDLNDSKQNMVLSTALGKWRVAAEVHSYVDGEEIISLIAKMEAQGGSFERIDVFVSESGVFSVAAGIIPSSRWRDIIRRTEGEGLFVFESGVAVRMADGAGAVPLSVCRDGNGKVVALRADLVAHEPVGARS